MKIFDHCGITGPSVMDSTLQYSLLEVTPLLTTSKKSEQWENNRKKK